MELPIKQGHLKTVLNNHTKSANKRNLSHEIPAHRGPSLRKVPAQRPLRDLRILVGRKAFFQNGRAEGGSCSSMAWPPSLVESESLLPGAEDVGYYAVSCGEGSQSQFVNSDLVFSGPEE